jgi:hypothetical protein
MQTIHLEPAQVPAALRGGYQGKMFKARVCEEMTIPADAGLWSGGSRSTYRLVDMNSGATVEAVNHNAAPWDGRGDRPVTLKPGYAVVVHSTFCGKDMGLTFYVHPANAAAMLPAPAELSPLDSIIIAYTAGRKSSYNGKDRYDMAQDDHRHGWRDAEAMKDLPFPTREEWNAGKVSLAARGYLTKAGAITPKGRNARPSRY